MFNLSHISNKSAHRRVPARTTPSFLARFQGNATEKEPHGERTSRKPLAATSLRASHASANPSAAISAHSHMEDAQDSFRSTMRHPRSLARGIPRWRPPHVRLPLTPGGPELAVTITRHRAGDRVRDAVRSFGESRLPAYLVTIRFSDPTGRPVSTAHADSWVERFTHNAPDHSVRELRGETSPTYCWLVDSSFDPIASPDSLFKEVGYAA